VKDRKITSCAACFCLKLPKNYTVKKTSEPKWQNLQSQSKAKGIVAKQDLLFCLNSFKVAAACLPRQGMKILGQKMYPFLLVLQGWQEDSQVLRIE